MDPSIVEASGQADIFSKSLGQANFWSDGPPTGEPSDQIDIFVRSLGQLDLWSDGPPAGRDILWPSVLLLWSGWSLVTHTPKVRLWVKLTFNQASGQADLWSDEPPAETSCGQVYYYFSQVDLWSDVPLWQRHLVAKCVTTLVRLTSGQMCPHQRHLVAKCVTASVKMISGQTYPLRMRLQVRLTLSQTLGQADLWFFSP